jgi:hypothetical protein
VPSLREVKAQRNVGQILISGGIKVAINITRSPKLEFFCLDSAGILSGGFLLDRGLISQQLRKERLASFVHNADAARKSFERSGN